MKIKIISLLIILFGSGYLSAQPKSKKADILWGQEFKASRKSTLDGLIGADKTGSYYLKSVLKGLYGLNSYYKIEHFNNQMNMTKSLKLVLKEQNKTLDFEFIILFSNKLYIFSSYKNQKLKKNILFVQSINKSTLLPEHDIRQIAEINLKKKRLQNSGEFHFSLSREENRLLIYYDSPYGTKENEVFGLHVFDENMNQLWNKEVTLTYKEGLFSIERFRVDNVGNVYLVGINKKEKRESKRNGEPNYKYIILSYTENGANFKEYPVELSDKFITDMQITITDEGDIICAGFYSDEGTYSIKGSYFLSIDHESKNIKHKSFKEFGIDFITQDLSKRQEKKTKKKAAKGKNVELFDYDLHEIIQRDDGGALLVGEQYDFDVVTTTYTDANGNMHSTTTYYYYYNDIVIVNINPEGDIDWIKKIPKYQFTVNDGGFFSSYALAVVNDNMYFIFNDNPKNLYYDKSKELFNFIKGKESITVLVTLTSDGEQTREALFNINEAGVLIRPKVCEQISDSNEVILFGQKKKIQRFAKLTFK